MYTILKIVTFSSDDGASFSLGDVDKSNTELSDDQNTSILSAIKSSKHDEERLRMYCERKIQKLVDKCRKKNIRFPQHYVNLSSKLAGDITLCTDAELIDLMTECIQSLGSDDSECESSSSDSSNEPMRKKVKTKKGGLLTPMMKSFDRTNPYNQAWSQHGRHVHTYCLGRTDVMIGGAQHSIPCLTLQQQHDIFQSQVYGTIPQLPSLETYPQSGQCNQYSSVQASGQMYLNWPNFNIWYDSLGCSLNNVNPNLVQPQFIHKVKAAGETGLLDTYQCGVDSPGSSSVEMLTPLFSSTPCSPDNTNSSLPLRNQVVLASGENAANFNEVNGVLFNFKYYFSFSYILHLINTIYVFKIIVHFSFILKYQTRAMLYVNQTLMRKMLTTVLYQTTLLLHRIKLMQLSHKTLKHR